METLARTRSEKLERVLLLVEILSRKNVLFLFATNCRDSLDPSFLRHRRLNKSILIPALSWEKRVEMSLLQQDPEFFAVLTTNFSLRQMLELKKSLEQR